MKIRKKSHSGRLRDSVSHLQEKLLEKIDSFSDTISKTLSLATDSDVMIDHFLGLQDKSFSNYVQNYIDSGKDRNEITNTLLEDPSLAPYTTRLKEIRGLLGVESDDIIFSYFIYYLRKTDKDNIENLIGREWAIGNVREGIKTMGKALSFHDHFKIPILFGQSTHSIINNLDQYRDIDINSPQRDLIRENNFYNKVRTILNSSISQVDLLKIKKTLEDNPYDLDYILGLYASGCFTEELENNISLTDLSAKSLEQIYSKTHSEDTGTINQLQGILLSIPKYGKKHILDEFVGNYSKVEIIMDLTRNHVLEIFDNLYGLLGDSYPQIVKIIFEESFSSDTGIDTDRLGEILRKVEIISEIKRNKLHTVTTGVQLDIMFNELSQNKNKKQNRIGRKKHKKKEKNKNIIEENTMIAQEDRSTKSYQEVFGEANFDKSSYLHELDTHHMVEQGDFPDCYWVSMMCGMLPLGNISKFWFLKGIRDDGDNNYSVRIGKKQVTVSNVELEKREGVQAPKFVKITEIAFQKEFGKKSLMDNRVKLLGHIAGTKFMGMMTGGLGFTGYGVLDGQLGEPDPILLGIIGTTLIVTGGLTTLTISKTKESLKKYKENMKKFKNGITDSIIYKDGDQSGRAFLQMFKGIVASTERLKVDDIASIKNIESRLKELDEGDTIITCSDPRNVGINTKLYKNHAYVVLDYNEDGEVTFVNPHNNAEIESLSLPQFLSQFGRFEVMKFNLGKLAKMKDLSK